MQPPAFMPGANGGKDKDTIFNIFEFTYDGSGMHCDATNVDYFCFPIRLTLEGKLGKQVGGILKTDRVQVFRDFEMLSTHNEKEASFKKLVIMDEHKNYIRVLAPQNGIKSILPQYQFPKNFYDDYVNHCWDDVYNPEKQNKILIVDTPFGTFTGQVHHEVLQLFNQQNKSQSVSIEKPAPNKTWDVFACAGILEAPNDYRGAVRARVGAALNRTVLHNQDVQPFCETAHFYDDNGPAWQVTNVYSKIMHQNFDKVYGFPFDDVCNGTNTKPLLQDPEPTSLELVLDEFKMK